MGRNIFAKYLPQNLKLLIKRTINHSPTEKLKINRIHLLRRSSKKDLQDQEYLENLLCNLGLNGEELFNFPRSLYQYCDQGLYSWQYPIQFSKYLILLSNLNIKSYLEIGVKHGGTFIITTEYLNKFNVIEKAIGIDLYPCRGLNTYKKKNTNIKSLSINSRSTAFHKLLKNEGPIDLTLIDGDHSYEGCISDFNLLKDNCRIIAFHDIVGMGVPGVVKAWNEIKQLYEEIFEFHEFTEQYDEVLNETGKTWLGLGIAIKKN